MAAGMHLSGKLGSIRNLVLLLNIQCIDVGPKAYGAGPFARRNGLTMDRPHHTGTSESPVRFNPPGLQLRRDELGRKRLFKRGLRMSMQFATPIRHFRMQILKTRDHVHRLDSVSGSFENQRSCFSASTASQNFHVLILPLNEVVDHTQDIAAYP
jgi:hypothetical protein